MNNKLTSLIGKYTLLLAITYAVEFGVNLLIQNAGIDWYTYIAIWMRFLPTVLSIIMNVVITIIMYSDIKKMSIKAPYAIVATLLLRPIGVCAFLIYVIISDKNESTLEPIDGILDR